MTAICGIGGSLSPDGEQIATTRLPQQADGGCTGGAITLIDQSGNRRPTGISGSPEGWMDAKHLVIQTPQGQMALFDVSGSRTIPVAASGAMVKLLPGSLG